MKPRHTAVVLDQFIHQLLELGLGGGVETIQAVKVLSFVVKIHAYPVLIEHKEDG